MRQLQDLNEQLRIEMGQNSDRAQKQVEGVSNAWAGKVEENEVRVRQLEDKVNELRRWGQ